MSNTGVLATINELIDVDDGEEELDCSNNLMKLANHSGLLFVKYTTYMAMELVVKKHFCKKRVEKLTPESRFMLIEHICEDEDVEFYSSILFATVGDCITSILLHSISFG